MTSRPVAFEHKPSLAGEAPAREPQSDAANRARLLRRLRESLEFAARTVRAADPNHSLWKVDLGHVTGFDKLMLEASVFAVLASRTECADEEVANLVSAVADRCDRERLIRDIQRQPAHLGTFGTALVVLAQFGYATQLERAVIAAAAASPFVQGFERTPFRLLDRNWVLRLAGRQRDDDTAAIRLTTAARRTHPIYMSREDVYAITHAVMYTTDFGRRQPPPAYRTKHLWQSVDASLAWCLAANDYDLTVELLLTQLLLKGEFSPYGSVAWGMVQRTWDELGFVPGPSLSAGEFEAIKEEHDRRQYAHYHMYHTVFVTGLLVNAMIGLGAPTAIPASEHVGPQRRVRNRAVGKLVQQWEGTADDGVLHRMATDSALIKSAKAYDLLQLRRLLAEVGERKSTLTTELASNFLAMQEPLADPAQLQASA